MGIDEIMYKINPWLYMQMCVFCEKENLPRVEEVYYVTTTNTNKIT